MATPPRVTHDEFKAALHRIHDRRRRAGDDDPQAFSEDPHDVLGYLRKRGYRGLISDDTGDDAIDAMILRVWTWWQGEGDDLWILEACEATGIPRKKIGAVIGVSTSQGIAERIARGRRRMRPDRVDAGTPVAAGTNDDRIRDLAAELTARRAEMPLDVAEDFHIEELTDALPRWRPGAPPPTSSVLASLRFLIGDLDEQVPAGVPLRPLVDLGVELVGTLSVTGERRLPATG